MKSSKTVKTISLESELWARCEAAAQKTRHSLTAWVGLKLSEALEGAPSNHPMPEFTASPQRAALPKPEKKATKEQEEFTRALNERLNLCRLDERLGRWSHFFIVGGEASVNRWGPLDSEEKVDYSTEAEDGSVIEEITPHEYSAQEAQAWLKRKQRTGHRLAWVYVSGDCHSITERHERRRRDTMRSDERYAHGLDALRHAEETERREIERFGMKTMYIEDAARDLHLLKALSVRDDTLFIPPMHLMNLYQHGKDLGWRPRRRFLESLTERVSRLKLTEPQRLELIGLEQHLLSLAAPEVGDKLMIEAPRPAPARIPEALE